MCTNKKHPQLNYHMDDQFHGVQIFMNLTGSEYIYHEIINPQNCLSFPKPSKIATYTITATTSNQYCMIAMQNYYISL